MTVLVGYASRHGSTRDIAERIAYRLGEHGIPVETAAMADVPDPATYDAYILGSAVRDGNWLPEASGFIRRHFDLSSGRPLWLFSVGAAAALARAPGSMWGKEPKGIAELRHAVHPRGSRVFSGVITRDQLRTGGQLMFTMLGGRYGDHRDWKAIDGFAEEIAAELAVPAAGADTG